MDTSHIAEGLRHLATPEDTLIIDPENSREHNPANLAAIRESLLELGQDQVIVYREVNRVVIKGNGRLQAARDLGWDCVAAIGVDEDEARALYRNVLDNRASDLATWNVPKLMKQLSALRESGMAISPTWSPQQASTVTQAAKDSLEPRQEKLTMKSVAFTEEQMLVVMAGVNRVRSVEGDPNMKAGRAIELMIADFLAG